MTWRDAAACRGADPDLFFHEFHGKKQPTKTTRAKAICTRCPVTAECLDYANEAMEPFGIWGGLAPRERKKLRALNGRGRGRRPLVGQKDLARVEGMTSAEAGEILGVATSTVRMYRRRMAAVS